MKTYALYALMVLSGLGLMTQVRADNCGEGCQQGCCQGCPSCGCCKTKKYCRVVCEMKKQVRFVYEMECDDLCILAPSQRCGTKCVTDSHTVCPCHREVVQVPSCCNYSRVVRKPIKIAVIDRVPAYKCVVDKVCCGCGARTNSCAATEPEAQAAVNAAAAQGILPTSAEQEVVLPVAEVSDTQATAQPAAPARASTGLMRLISIK